MISATSEQRRLFSHATYGDGKYNNKENCDWTLKSSDSKYAVKLKFVSFEIEAEIDCGYDYVEVGL